MTLRASHFKPRRLHFISGKRKIILISQVWLGFATMTNTSSHNKDASSLTAQLCPIVTVSYRAHGLPGPSGQREIKGWRVRWLSVVLAQGDPHLLRSQAPARSCHVAHIPAGIAGEDVYAIPAECPQSLTSSLTQWEVEIKKAHVCENSSHRASDC